jgi:beta-lactamase class A
MIALLRRLTLLLALAPLTGACADARAPSLQATLDALAAQARPGTFGIEVLDLQTNVTTQVNADRAYPMMSVFKAPVAAAVLDAVQAGRLRLDQQVALTPADVVPGAAVPSLGSRLARGPLTVTVDALLTASVSESDNTAVDALLKLVGGPRQVTAYLRRKGIEGMRVEIDERSLSRRFEDLAPGQSVPVGESRQQHAARLRRGYAAFLASSDNTTTLASAIAFLHLLHDGQLLPPAATQKLIALMTHQALPNRIRAGLPTGFGYAYKTGTAGGVDGRTGAWNDIGIVTAPDGRTLLVAAFMTDTRLDQAARNRLHAALGRAVAQALLHP